MSVILVSVVTTAQMTPVHQTALAEAHALWGSVSVTQGTLVMRVRWKYVPTCVPTKVSAMGNNVAVTQVGVDLTVVRPLVPMTVLSMVNVGTAHATVWKGGMVRRVTLKIVLTIALAMVIALVESVDVTLASRVLTARS